MLQDSGGLAALFGQESHPEPADRGERCLGAAGGGGHEETDDEHD
jgi:hypothetical protein